MNENIKEDKNKAKMLFKEYYKQSDGNQKEIRKKILSVINSKYARISNTVVDLLWKELNKKFPS